MLTKVEQELEDAYERAFAESGGEDELFYFDLAIFPLIAASSKHKKALEERAKLWGIEVRKAKGRGLTEIADKIDDENPWIFPGGGRGLFGFTEKYDVTFEVIMRLLISAHIRDRAASAAKQEKFLRFIMMSPTRKKTLFKF